MQGLGQALDVEETRVESAEPFHVQMLGAMTSHPNPIGSNCNKFRETQCAHVEIGARGPADDYAAVNWRTHVDRFPDPTNRQP